MKKERSWTPYSILKCRHIGHNDITIFRILLYGEPSFDGMSNILMLNASIDFLMSSKRFDGPLIQLSIDHSNTSFRIKLIIERKENIMP